MAKSNLIISGRAYPGARHWPRVEIRRRHENDAVHQGCAAIGAKRSEMIKE
jgi:hypothetical protein